MARRVWRNTNKKIRGKKEGYGISLISTKTNLLTLISNSCCLQPLLPPTSSSSTSAPSSHFLLLFPPSPSFSLPRLPPHLFVSLLPSIFYPPSPTFSLPSSPPSLRLCLPPSLSLLLFLLLVFASSLSSPIFLSYLLPPLPCPTLSTVPLFCLLPPLPFTWPPLPSSISRFPSSYSFPHSQFPPLPSSRPTLPSSSLFEAPSPLLLLLLLPLLFSSASASAFLPSSSGYDSGLKYFDIH